MNIEEISKEVKSLNKQWLGDEKATVWVCGLVPAHPESKLATCLTCGGACFYTEDKPVMVEEKHEKICIRCAYENSENLTEIQRETLRLAVEKADAVLGNTVAV